MAKGLLDALERIAMSSVALTERAIANAGTDLTFVQWRVLLIVGERDDGATVGEIAARIGAQASPASRLITRLRRRGVLLTAKDAADGRVTRVHLTDAGRSLRRLVLDRRRHDLAAMPIRVTPEDVDAIDRLADALGMFR